MRVVPAITNLQRSNTFESLALAATADPDHTYIYRLYPIKISRSQFWQQVDCILIMLRGAMVSQGSCCLTSASTPSLNHLLTSDTDLLLSYFKIMILLTENIYLHTSMNIYITMQVHKYCHISIWKRTIVFLKQMFYVSWCGFLLESGEHFLWDYGDLKKDLFSLGFYYSAGVCGNVKAY